MYGLAVLSAFPILNTVHGYFHPAHDLPPDGEQRGYLGVKVQGPLLSLFILSVCPQLTPGSTLP